MSNEWTPDITDEMALGIHDAVIGLMGDAFKPKPHPPVERKMLVDLPVVDMRIGMTYLEGRRKGTVLEVIPLGHYDRTHVEVVVKFPNKGDEPTVKRYRHEMLGTFETEV